MPELSDRFASLSRTRAPDLWPEIEDREPGRPVEPSSGRRLVVALAAFVIAIAGIGLAGVTFGGSRPGVVSGTSGTAEAANGPIYFRVGGADGGSRIESIEAGGTGRHVVFPEDSPVHYDRLSFSPDGTRIAFSNFLEGEYGIETANPDGSDIVRLTDGVNDTPGPPGRPMGRRSSLPAPDTTRRSNNACPDSHTSTDAQPTST